MLICLAVSCLVDTFWTAESVGASQDRARVVGVGDVLEDRGDVRRAGGHHVANALAAAMADLGPGECGVVVTHGAALKAALAERWMEAGHG